MAKDIFKDGDLCTDSIVYKMPDTTTLKQEFTTIKDSLAKQVLEIEVDVTHGGYVNKNGYFYTSEGQAKGVSSFFVPFKKPVLAQHSAGDTPVGRSYSAVYIPLSNVNDKEDITTPKSKIRVKSIITDEKAIDYILDGRYFTVSSGGAPKNKPICSICGLTVDNEECNHIKGRKYEEKLCYWIIGEMEYKEYSFVNMPADTTPEHAATVVGLKFIETAIADSANTNFNLTDIKEVITDGEQSQEEKDKGVKEEDKSKTDDDKDGKPKGENKEETKEENKDESIVAEAKTITTILSDNKTSVDDIKKFFEVLKKADLTIGSACELVENKDSASGLMDIINTLEEIFSNDFDLTAHRRSALMKQMKKMNKDLSIVKSKSEAIISGIYKAYTALRNIPPSVDFDVTKLAQNKIDLQQKDAQIVDANKQIEQLNQDNRRNLAEKVIDLSIIAGKDTISKLNDASDVTARKEVYDDMVEDLVKQTTDSLVNTIADINKDFVIIKKDLNKVTDPTITDKEDKTKTKPETKVVNRTAGDILFGTKKK